MACGRLLREYQIHDIEMEIRAAAVDSSIDPKLLEPGLTSEPTTELRDALIHTLSPYNAPTKTSRCEGAGGFFMVGRGDNSKTLLATARHVDLEPAEDDYTRPGTPLR